MDYSETIYVVYQTSFSWIEASLDSYLLSVCKKKELVTFASKITIAAMIFYKVCVNKSKQE